jgi:hypothetical protein
MEVLRHSEAGDDSQRAEHHADPADHVTFRGGSLAYWASSVSIARAQVCSI